YEQFVTPEDLPRSDRSRKLGNKNLARMTYNLNNKSEISQK
ncbi:unnamed protein product, partial [Didymodactylos carnosus]